MSFTFTLTEDSLNTTREFDDPEIEGEDIALNGGFFTETPHGDLAVVVREAAAKQSVIREMPANPGTFARRPQWGGGLSGLIFKGMTPNTRERAVSRARARLLANPRIARVNEVSTTVEVRDDGRADLRLHVRADAVGGPVDLITVIKPPGVS